MKDHNDTYTLPNGVGIPCIGYGTWKTPDGDVAVNAVVNAIEAGYRHIDTAQGYRNEASVGKAIKLSGIPREELFITTKLHNNNHSYELVMKSFEESLEKLQLDYLDLFLVHWPNPISVRDRWEEANAGMWQAMEELYEAKKIRAIGVSNFCPRHMEALLKTAKIVPMVNQIFLAPGETQEETVDWCKERGIVVEAYSPLGNGRIFEVPEMKALAEKYQRSVAQICIRWSLQRGYLPLPKSVTPSRMAENLKVFDFELDPQDVQMIADLKGCVGFAADPDQITF